MSEHIAQSADYDLAWALVRAGGPDAVAALDRVTRQAAAEGSERIEPGAEAAHRDDLARDVVRLWLEFANYRGSTARWDQLESALRRLAAGYTQPPEGDVVYHTGLPRCSHEGWHPRASCTDA